MKPENKRKKGARFERFIAKEIEAEGLGKAGREANSGAGFRKGDIACSLDFLIECKNQKTIKILDWIGQAKKQAEMGNYSSEKWMLVFRDPQTPETNPNIYAIVDFWEMLKLLKKNQEPRIKEPDREMAWKLKRLVEYGKSLLKELETE